MTVELGTIGIWQPGRSLTPELARSVEQLGYGTIWIGGSPDGQLRLAERLLGATERVSVATGIVNMWRDDPATVGASYRRITARHPERFLLGVGIGHPEAIDGYQNPYDTMVEYLDQLEDGGVPREHLVLAALGPRVLKLAAERAAGAHPYLTTPAHTERAGLLLGAGPLLAPEQKVVIDTDPDSARALGRENVRRYLGLSNYRRNLLRLGWTEADLEDGGSDRLVDALVVHGDPDTVAQGVTAHLDAGADHVCIQPLGTEPAATYRALAGILS